MEWRCFDWQGNGNARISSAWEKRRWHGNGMEKQCSEMGRDAKEKRDKAMIRNAMERHGGEWT